MMKFRIKAAIRSYIRRFLDSRQFNEVLIPKPALPFAEICLSNYYGLHLKQCVVGGLEPVYAIGRQFRGEMSQYHEDTTCSFCQAGADYLDFMNLTEEMLSGWCVVYLTVTMLTGLVKDLRGGGYGLDIDFTPPFRRMDMIDELEKMANLAIPTDLYSAKANKYLLDACLELNIKCLPPIATSSLLDKLLGHFLAETFTNPTFIINHPEIMSPDVKSHRSKAGRAERFELFINKLKICSGQTELNDPILQRQRFADLRKDQHRQPSDDDDKAMTLEGILCETLEYGLPPAAGGVLSIDRLVMLFTGIQNIEEVSLPPLWKPQDDPSN